MNKKVFFGLILLLGTLTMKAQKLEKVTVKGELFKVKEVFYVKQDSPAVRQGKYTRTIGNLKTIGEYTANQRSGVWKSFGDDGELIQSIEFPGKVVDNVRPFDVSERHWVRVSNQFFEVKPEQVPSFIGGNAALYRFVNTLLRYPAPARRMGIEGRAFISVVITKEGKLTDAIIEKEPGGGIGEEALRVIQELPQEWIPGKVNGQWVDIKLIIPITFRLG